MSHSSSACESRLIHSRAERRPPTSGLTLLEVVIAIVLLGVGIIATMGTSAAATRMIGQGRSSMKAVQAAAGRMEALRAVAYATSPACASLTNGADTVANGVVTTWQVSASGQLRTITVAAQYQTPGRVRTDTLVTTLRCD